ncbi:MAG: DUF2769 domain-containing protein [Methanoregula sp.]|nr:DUF2769 domain-containing protein [Methanoregula sp.]
MDEKERAMMEENKKKCICGSCPSYTECMRAGAELLFCVTGRSKDCKFDPKGCLCPACPVTKVLGLKKAYYCIRGTEQEQK